ncbi:MAG: hypothetical protein J7L90_01185 [Dehalococcoidia bacterium]|nr:hypothetical protein [Dehalococcoidia bacterium]
MKTSKVLIAVLLLVALISAGCIYSTSSVQDFMPGNNIWNGMRDFGNEVNATNIDSLDTLPELSQGATLVEIPYTHCEEGELSRIKEFVVQGGNLLLLDDFGYGNDVLEYLGVNARFSGARLLDPLFCYKNPMQPRITDFSPEVRQAGVSVVTLNYATGLTGVDELEVLAWSSSCSFLDYDGNGEWSYGEEKCPSPVAARVKLGKGKVTIVSDPSIMINSMRGKGDNTAFIEYLVARDGVGGEKILINRASLDKDVLDRSRLGIVGVREIFSAPYSLLGLVAIIFVVVSQYTLRKEELFD